MGLDISVHKYGKQIYNSGYGGFTRFRIALAKAYNKEYGELYEKYIFDGNNITDADVERAKEIGNKDLNIFLFHSDCEGKLTPQECRKIYNVTKDLKCDYISNNYHYRLNNENANQLELFNDAFKHCIKNRVCMIFH